MGKIRPVNVSFQLASNQVIDFTMVRNNCMLCMDNEAEEEYGYAADIAFLDLYVKELEAVQIPVISYSDIGKSGEFEKWVKSITTLKTDANIWNNQVLPAIRSLPGDMDSHAERVKENLDYAVEDVKDIVDYLESEKSDRFKRAVVRFDKDLSALQEETSKQTAALKKFFARMEEYQNNIITESEQLKALSKSASKLTEEQQKQIDKINNKIAGYESSRKSAIAGACVTGVLAGGVIGGGIAAMVLIPGVGIVLGIVCFFGAAILGVGTLLCSLQAENLKKMIEAEVANKSNIDKEKIAIALIGGQFSALSENVKALTDSVKDIISNWGAVSDALDNIQKAAKKLEGKSSVTTINEWKVIDNDLSAIRTIVDTLNEAIETMDVKTKIYTGCDLSDCTTEDDILSKLKEFVEEKIKKEKAS